MGWRWYSTLEECTQGCTGGRIDWRSPQRESKSEFKEYLSKLVSYVKLKCGQLNTRTCGVREGIHGVTSMNVLSVLVRSCDVHDMYELYVNSFYDLSVHVLNVLFINVCPLEVLGLHKLSSNGLNALSVHVFPRDLRYSRDITSDSGSHGLNGINGLGPYFFH